MVSRQSFNSVGTIVYELLIFTFFCDIILVISKIVL